MPAIAARSFEPAKRCARPQSLSASTAGRRRASISARTSMAAAMRAAGVMRSEAEDDARREDEPHDEQQDRPDQKSGEAPPHVVARHVDSGVDKPARHEH